MVRTQHFISALAHARARCEGLLLHQAGLAFTLGCLVVLHRARTVPDTFLELPGSVGVNGDIPASHEVERDFAFVGLAF